MTGATDGIGREFALQLAKKGFNILLVSRNPEKLGSVAAEIEVANPGTKTKTQAVDFALGDERQYDGLEAVVKDLDIGVLGKCPVLHTSGASTGLTRSIW